MCVNERVLVQAAAFLPTVIVPCNVLGDKYSSVVYCTVYDVAVGSIYGRPSSNCIANQQAQCECSFQNTIPQSVTVVTMVATEYAQNNCQMR